MSEWMIARAGSRAFAAGGVGAVDGAEGYMIGRRNSSWADNAGRALPYGRASADMDTIAVDVAADNGEAEERVGRHVGKVGTCVAYEDA